ncbi:MAG: tRNA lysidine(34) synthetase TilS [Oscillospiraceae bacterium]
MVSFNAAQNAIAKYNMIKNGDTVIVALSGGADSMAMLRFLLSARLALGIEVKAAHVNHGMRGEESDSDEEFVKRECARLGVMLYTCRLSPNGEHSEEWARKERYAFLDSLATGDNIKIATAHTASDNAETVLLNIARGTSLKGAGGIPPTRNAYIRPFLGISRTEIEQYCEENQIPFVTDATNLTDVYARNRVRRQLLPILNTVHEGAQDAVCRFAEDMRETYDYLDAEANKLLKSAKATNEKTTAFFQTDAYSAPILRSAMSALQKAALVLIIGEYSPLNATLIAKAQKLLCKKSGKLQINSQYTLCLAKELLYVQDMAVNRDNYAEYSVPFAEGKIMLWGKMQAIVATQTYEEFLNSSKVKKKDLFFHADCGKIQASSLFRTKKEGDTFEIPQRNVSKTLKKLFNEDGVPVQQRAQMPLLVCGKQVLWMPIYGFCKGLLPNENTKKVISITLLHDMEEL